MPRTALKIAALAAAALLLSAAAVSMVVYGSVDPCEMLSEERAREARDAAEDALGDAAEARSPGEAAGRARAVLDRARGNVERAAAAARAAVEDMETPGCVRELWYGWF